MRRYIGFLILILGSFGYATSYDALSFDELLARAEVAFYGTVISTTVIDQEGEPWTQVSFEVLEPFRGLEKDASSFDLLFYGGQTETVNKQISLMPTFTTGEKVLVFAYKAQYYSPIVGFRQGLWRETENGFRGETGDLLSLDGDTLVLKGAGLSPSDALASLKQAFEVKP